MLHVCVAELHVLEGGFHFFPRVMQSKELQLLEVVVDIEDGSALVPVDNSAGEVCKVFKHTVIGQVHEIEEEDGM